jgi:hypothetical protein
MARLGAISRGKKNCSKGFPEQLPASPPGHARECRVVNPAGVNIAPGWDESPLDFGNQRLLAERTMPNANPLARYLRMSLPHIWPVNIHAMSHRSRYTPGCQILVHFCLFLPTLSPS